jgi:hypothetical protein
MVFEPSFWHYLCRDGQICLQSIITNQLLGVEFAGANGRRIDLQACSQIGGEHAGLPIRVSHSINFSEDLR